MENSLMVLLGLNLKEKQKEYESLWKEEGGEYDPEGVADNTTAQGELTDVPQEEDGSCDVVETVAE